MNLVSQKLKKNQQKRKKTNVFDKASKLCNDLLEIYFDEYNERVDESLQLRGVSTKSSNFHFDSLAVSLAFKL